MPLQQISKALLVIKLALTTTIMLFGYILVFS
jgi:hypothetical protein